MKGQVIDLKGPENSSPDFYIYEVVGIIFIALVIRFLLHGQLLGLCTTYQYIAL